MERILVGVDGSAESQRALAWGLAEAHRCDAELVVLHAYKGPAEGNPYAPGLAHAPETVMRELLAAERRWRGEQHRRARQHAESLVSSAVRRAAPSSAGADDVGGR